MTSHVESDSGNSGLGSRKDKHKNRARVPAVVRQGAKKKTGGVTKSTNGGKTPKVGKTKAGKKVAQKKRHQQEQLKNQEKDEAEAQAAAMEEEEEKEDEEEEEEEDLLGDRPKVVERRNQSKKTWSNECMHKNAKGFVEISRLAFSENREVTEQSVRVLLGTTVLPRAMTVPLGQN
jgi:hypothetical protein